jgi:hypothetical protein
MPVRRMMIMLRRLVEAEKQLTRCYFQNHFAAEIRHVLLVE